MTLNAKDREMIDRFGKIVGEQMKEQVKEIAETMKKLEPLVNKHELIIGEDEQSGLRGQVATHWDRLREIENFKTEIKAKAGLIATLAAMLVSLLVWLGEHLLKK